MQRTFPSPVAVTADAWRLARYGGWAAPLAFAALPLYVHLPAHMVTQPGWSLAAIGTVLLAVRAADAALDPWLGRRIDRLGGGQGLRLLWIGLAGAALLGSGWSVLFLLRWPAGPQGAALLALALLLTSIGYSVAQIAHQAWGVALAGSDASRAGQAIEGAQARWVGAREAGALAGVIVASAVPAVAGWPLTVSLWWLLALLGALALGTLVGSQRPLTPAVASGVHAEASRAAAWPAAWTRPLLVQLVNGIAAAVPATLVLLVVRDVLGGGPALEATALLTYFGAATAAVPLAVRAVARWGAHASWACGMLLAALGFLPFVLMPTTPVFLAVCALTGAALTLETLAGQTVWISRLEAAGPGQRARGFGWWALVNKSTLALAAGLALPLVQALGYQASQPGQASGRASELLAVYVGLPVAFKLLAVAMLCWPQRWRARTLPGRVRP